MPRDGERGRPQYGRPMDKLYRSVPFMGENYGLREDTLRQMEATWKVISGQASPAAEANWAGIITPEMINAGEVLIYDELQEYFTNSGDADSTPQERALIQRNFGLAIHFFGLSREPSEGKRRKEKQAQSVAKTFVNVALRTFRSDFLVRESVALDETLSPAHAKIHGIRESIHDMLQHPLVKHPVLGIPFGQILSRVVNGIISAKTLGGSYAVKKVLDMTIGSVPGRVVFDINMHGVGGWIYRTSDYRELRRVYDFNRRFRNLPNVRDRDLRDIAAGIVLLHGQAENYSQALRSAALYSLFAEVVPAYLETLKRIEEDSKRGN